MSTELKLFVSDLFYEIYGNTDIIDLGIAESDINNFKNIQLWDIPEDCTPVNYMNAWNTLHIANYIFSTICEWSEDRQKDFFFIYNYTSDVICSVFPTCEHLFKDIYNTLEELIMFE